MTLMVRVMGLEPIRLSTHAPQTCLSAYSSTLAIISFPDCLNIISDYFSFVKPFLKKISEASLSGEASDFFSGTAMLFTLLRIHILIHIDKEIISRCLRAEDTPAY